MGWAEKLATGRGDKTLIALLHLRREILIEQEIACMGAVGQVIDGQLNGGKAPHGDFPPGIQRVVIHDEQVDICRHLLGACRGILLLAGTQPCRMRRGRRCRVGTDGQEAQIKSLAQNGVSSMAREGPAQERGGIVSAAQGLRQCQAAHDVAAADGGGSINSKGGAHDSPTA